MKHQALFSSKDKSKNIKCLLLQFLFGALRVKSKHHLWRTISAREVKRKSQKSSSFVKMEGKHEGIYIHFNSFNSPSQVSQQPSFPGFLQLVMGHRLLEHSISPWRHLHSSHLSLEAGTSCPGWNWRPAYMHVWLRPSSQTGQQVTWSWTGSIQLMTGQEADGCLDTHVMEPSCNSQ